MTIADKETSPPPRRLLQSTGAILLGFVLVVVLSLGTDEVLHLLKVYPPWGEPFNDPIQNALALSYRIVYTVFGGYVAALVSPRNPIRHALILGIIGLVFGTAGAIVTIPMNLGPAWYPIGIAVTALPGSWLGGLFVKGR